MSEYLGLFLDELDEQLQILDERLLELERDSVQPHTIGTIFRAAHTLKGSSAAMGLIRIKELTHQMENIFDLMRGDRLKASQTLMNVLFECVDEIKAMKTDIQAGKGENERDIGDLLGRLAPFLHPSATGETDEPNAKASAPSEAEANTLEGPGVAIDSFHSKAIYHAWEKEFQALRIRAEFMPDEAFAYARALVVNNVMDELGEVIATYPTSEELADSNAEFGYVEFLLLTEEKEEAVSQKLSQISQMGPIQVRAIERSELAPDQAQRKLRGAESAPGAAAAESKAARSGQTVRVDVERLEKLLNLVGELLIDNTRLHEVRKRLYEQYGEQPDINDLGDIAHQIDKVIGELQDGMMKTRMLPIEQLFNRFPRMMRDVAQQVGKEFNFVMEGKETELDRTLIEEISDPIIHILRNSADHAIEPPEERQLLGKPRQGTIVLKAAHQDNQIVISISDDGKGIDPAKIKAASVAKGLITQAEADKLSDQEAVRLIFRSGVSTAKQVTDLSGRGVGMDIVRAHIERLNGLVDIETKVGRGTTFTIKLPLTLAIIRSLLVGVEEHSFALPLVNVVEIVRLEPEQLQNLQGQEVCVIRGSVFPLIRLSDKLGLGKRKDTVSEGRPLVVMIGVAEKRVCLAVDRTIGNQEIVIKSLGSYVGQVPYLAGATLLGDGRIGLILDAASFCREDHLDFQQEEELQDAEAAIAGSEEQYVSFRMEREQYAIRAGKVREIITAPSLSTIAASPNGVMGMIHLRGRTVPVIDLSRGLGLGPRSRQDSSRIIVMELDGQELGIWTDEIGEILRIGKKAIEPAQEVLPTVQSDWIEGVYHDGGQMIILLGIDRRLPGMDGSLTIRESLLSF
ncbi:chemotaxis protein CheW [Cohnella sp. AR92]|uniref:chemotaxis protein CheW n=1 Tax=Cohnella sp. AR92 TaxID=648716 RepID=UPI000F8CB497|nr:chemotaxis protein CheW [Cohnella sp. AR92]RUS46772.1 chemotaxis protein CheA [Cohnella sp. AR92]